MKFTFPFKACFLPRFLITRCRRPLVAIIYSSLVQRKFLFMLCFKHLTSCWIGLQNHVFNIHPILKVSSWKSLAPKMAWINKKELWSPGFPCLAHFSTKISHAINATNSYETSDCLSCTWNHDLSPQNTLHAFCSLVFGSNHNILNSSTCIWSKLLNWSYKYV